MTFRHPLSRVVGNRCALVRICNANRARPDLDVVRMAHKLYHMIKLGARFLSVVVEYVIGITGCSSDM